ncbi:MAG: flagellar basal body P-ring formation protein FlgA [Alphaproteobacteria bacterium]|nr:flagellar basal body P-ring formation protein FlgA [Alphaproteobacteria bacterium]
MPRTMTLILLAMLLPSAVLAQPGPRQAITADAIAAALTRALGDRLPPGPVQLDLDNPAVRLYVPVGDAPDLHVDGITYDARMGRVAATVSAAEDEAAEPVRVTGRLSRMVDLPVLVHPVAPGDPIAAQDLEMIAVRADRTTQSYAAAFSDLVGKTPRRPIRLGEPIRPSDIQVPTIIHRGELVTLILQSRTMVLTAQVKALDDGGQGASIRVVNTRSGRMLDAIVSAPGAATLAAPLLAAR